MTGCGKKENYVLEKSKRKLIGGHWKPQYSGQVTRMIRSKGSGLGS